MVIFFIIAVSSLVPSLCTVSNIQVIYFPASKLLSHLKYGMLVVIDHAPSWDPTTRAEELLWHPKRIKVPLGF